MNKILQLLTRGGAEPQGEDSRFHPLATRARRQQVYPLATRARIQSWQVEQGQGALSPNNFQK